MNILHIKELIAFLRAIERTVPECFDMSDWGNMDGTETRRCNTVGCIAGSCYFMQHGQPAPYSISVNEFARIYLGLDAPQAESLFIPETLNDESYHRIPVSAAIHVLEALLESDATPRTIDDIWRAEIKYLTANNLFLPSENDDDAH